MLEGIFNPEKKGRSGIYIAEIGLNHNGDPDTARRMILSAAEAGADAVKFQTIVPELLNSVYTKALLETGRESYTDRSAIDFFAAFSFSADQYRNLKALAEERGLVFFSAPFDSESVALLEDIGVPLYKIASSEVTNIPLIRRIAATGRPAVMSTGISSRNDIMKAVETFRSAGGSGLVLLHCVSNYPLNPRDANMQRIISLRDEFGLHVGFSDHSVTNRAMIMAAVMGARIFEKHFTIDRNFECPDKAVSAAPDDFRLMIEEVEESIAMLGSGAIDFGAAEEPVARAARRSLFAARFIAAGSAINPDDIIALRPGVGMPAGGIDELIGRKTRTDIEKDHLLRPGDFE
jgi:N-acetylneuraminate synthase/N,N'-diacetyllegionaminate synthase